MALSGAHPLFVTTHRCKPPKRKGVFQKDPCIASWKVKENVGNTPYLTILKEKNNYELVPLSRSKPNVHGDYSGLIAISHQKIVKIRQFLCNPVPRLDEI